MRILKMTSNMSRDNILKSWAGVSEVNLIKDVATKGQHIQLCIDYLAKKRNIPRADYEVFFHDIVGTYVQRLLTERLVFKADNVLRNVQRDIKCFYYQFAMECNDTELREIVLDYLQEREAQTFVQDEAQLHFHWELLQQLKSCPTLLAKCKIHMRGRVNLESFIKADTAFSERIMVELFFETKNTALLQYLSKYEFWNYLVDSQRQSDLIIWVSMHQNEVQQEDVLANYSDLEKNYLLWAIETEMYDYALSCLKMPNEVLRDCFARSGFFFQDERENVQKIFHRICTTESFKINCNLLEKLPIGRYLLERGYFVLMLQDFVSAREVEELAEKFQEHKVVLKFIATLKTNSLMEKEGFEQITFATKTYLEAQKVNFQNEQPIVSMFEFLCSESSVTAFNCFFSSSALKYLPYLQLLGQRFQDPDRNMTYNIVQSKIPAKRDLLKRFKNFDFEDIRKETNFEHFFFSNDVVIKKLGKKHYRNFIHFLKQERSSYAVYFLLIDLLQKYSQITSPQLFSACQSVTELALQNANDSNLLMHCVAFIEMIGFDTQNLRSFLKLSSLLGNIESVPSFSFLIEQVEYLLLSRLKQHPEHFPLDEYQGLMHIAADGNEFQNKPSLILSHYASEDDWWRILAVLQYFEISVRQLKSLIKHFKTRCVGEHLLRALTKDDTHSSSTHHSNTSGAERPKRHANSSRQKQKKFYKLEHSTSTARTSLETITSSMGSSNEGVILQSTNKANRLRFLPDASGDLDLFAIILLSNSTISDQNITNAVKFYEIMQDNITYSTSVNLMKNSIKCCLPVLNVLAATCSTTNVDWNWFVWLSGSTNQWSEMLKLQVTDLNDLPWRLIESSIKECYTAAVLRSFLIFYPQNPLVHLFKFLNQTHQYQRDFSEETMHEVRLYFLAWSNDEIKLPICTTITKEQIMKRSLKLLLLHLKYGFNSTLDQYKFLSCICQADISDICGLPDFCLLNSIYLLLQNVTDNVQRFSVDFERLMQPDNKEYQELLNALLAAKEFDVAIGLANLLNLPINDIVYSKWVRNISNENCISDETLQTYEDEMVEHSMPPALLVNFFLFTASNSQFSAVLSKYLLLKRALNVIKKHHLFPNETFDRDQIEYQMIVCYLQIDYENPDVNAKDLSCSKSEEKDNLEIYHSEYYEEIMLKERCVLYKSFVELKELAGIEDLNVSYKTPLTATMESRLEGLLNRLLDDGDIVEALRLQELFECRPIDLRFVVFCMALAEGVTTIYSMSTEERQLLRDIEKSSFAKFNKRMLLSSGSTSTQAYGSPGLKLNEDLSDSSSTLEFEEIPSKEKRETLDTIQGIASKLRYGVNIGKRIVLAYRAAMYLDKEYLDVLRTKDVAVLLKSVSEEECLHRLLVVSDIVTSTQMTAHEIAELLAFEVTTAVIRPRFYIFSSDNEAKNTFKNAYLWGYNIDREMHLFLELTPNTTKLGDCLLEYADALKAYRKFQDNKPYDHTTSFEKLAEIIARYGLPSPHSAQSSPITVPTTSGSNSPSQVLSHKKQNLIYVELLIKAHQCYVHECSMEGIANILNRTKSLCSTLTHSKSWKLIVRMLTGIGHYREMFYCFDALIENSQFESLLGQFDEEKTISLRQAILSYLREYCPENSKEFRKLAALHFNMYKELAEIWEQDSQTAIAKMLSVAQVGGVQQWTNTATPNKSKNVLSKLRSSPEIIASLHQIMENYTHATENYLLDKKLLLAQKSVSKAELIAMQIDLATKALHKNQTAGLSQLCVCVLNVQTQEEFCQLVNSELSVPQSMILNRAYGFEINWSEAILSQYVMLDHKTYLDEYLANLTLTDSIIDNLVKSFQIQNSQPNQQMEEHLAILINLVKSVTLKYKLASLLSFKSIVMSLINDHTSHYLRDTNYGRKEKLNIFDS